MNRATLWHVIANAVSPHGNAHVWFNSCQYTPTDMPAHDHDLTAGLLARGLLISAPSQDLRSQWFVAELTPLTVAGAAAASGNVAFTAFPFDP
jgi:hypothetical protein